MKGRGLPFLASPADAGVLTSTDERSPSCQSTQGSSSSVMICIDERSVVLGITDVGEVLESVQSARRDPAGVCSDSVVI
jgi:hypothetical protein